MGFTAGDNLSSLCALPDFMLSDFYFKQCYFPIYFWYINIVKHISFIASAVTNTDIKRFCVLSSEVLIFFPRFP